MIICYIEQSKNLAIDIKGDNNMQTYTDNIFVNLNEALKLKWVKDNSKINYNKVANATINVGYLDNNKINRAIFYLRSKGCEWSCKTNGGCFMCGHYFGTAKGKKLPKNSYLNQFIEEYKKYDFTDIPMICIYNAGSILNDEEISHEELIEILTIININKNIVRIVLESRPEFINSDILEKISETCKGQTIEIGIGLETSDDHIRNKCINKGFIFTDYLKAVCKIKKFSNIKVLTYITVKPLFLTINEGIDDVVNSIEVISDFTDIISLEPISIQKHTLIDYLWEKNLYSPPKGWMVKDIIIKLNNLNIMDKFELRIGGFEFFPIPDLVINNCDKCNKKLYEAINSFNSSKKLDKLIALDCTCYNNYLEQKTHDSEDELLDDRVSTIMNQILQKII